MKILGYIVSEKKIKGLDFCVKQVDNIGLADRSKPVLIVGWDKAKEQGDYTNILNKKLGDNLFWTFGKTESRSDFELDLSNFYNYIYNNIINNIKYININIFKIKYNKIKKILYYILYSKEDKTIYINNGMLYIPFKGDVIGVSLRIMEYCGIKEEKILKKLTSNPHNKICDNTSKSILKLSNRLGNNKYIIPNLI